MTTSFLAISFGLLEVTRGDFMLTLLIQVTTTTSTTREMTTWGEDTKILLTKTQRYYLRNDHSEEIPKRNCNHFSLKCSFNQLLHHINIFPTRIFFDK